MELVAIVETILKILSPKQGKKLHLRQEAYRSVRHSPLLLARLDSMFFLRSCSGFVALIASVSSFGLKPFARAHSTSRILKMASFYDIVEKDANGNEFPFSNFRGKVVYGVNVASRCGYTASGYALLSRIAAMKDQGVEVAIFPCNQVRSLSYGLA